MLLNPGEMSNLSASQVGSFEGEGDVSSAKLFIGGLSYDTTDASLANYFRQYGEIASAVVLRDPVSSHSRGFGFVTFTSVNGARNVLAHSRNHIVDGRKVEAKVAVPKSQSSPRKAQSHQSMGGYGYGMNVNPLNLNLGQLGDPFLQQRPIGINYDLQTPLFNTQLAPADVFGSVPGYVPQAEPLFGFEQQYTYSPARTTQPQQQLRFQENLPAMEERAQSRHSPTTEEKKLMPSTSLRRPTYPQLDHMPEPPSRLRKFSMPPQKLHDLGELESSLHGLVFSSNQPILRVFDVPLGVGVLEVRSAFSAFGEIEKVEQGMSGEFYVEFTEPEVTGEVLSMAGVDGSINVGGSQVKVEEKEKEVAEEPLSRQLTRSNSSPLDGPILDSEHNFSRSRFPTTRTKSVSQNMLMAGGSLLDEPSLYSHTPQVFRDDKMRSLSLTGDAINLQAFRRLQLGREQHRRSSSIARPTAASSSFFQQSRLDSNGEE